MNIVLILLLLLIVVILIWALFGTSEKIIEHEKHDTPDVLLRRRATDREIEEKYPDRRVPLRRKTDAETLEEIREIDDEFKLPYLTDEIISEASRFRVYRRTLINAEIYARKADFTTAISLYEGVNSRINDIETNQKIEADIDYLKHYREYLAAKKEEKRSIETPGAKKSRELKLSLDGPITIPDKIQIGLTAPIQQPAPPPIDIDRIVEQIAQKFKEEELFGKRDTGEIERYRDEINRLEKKVDELSHIERLAESERKPTIIEAKYESPVPLILDPKPILDLLEKIPKPKQEIPGAESPVEQAITPPPDEIRDAVELREESPAEEIPVSPDAGESSSPEIQEEAEPHTPVVEDSASYDNRQPDDYTAQTSSLEAPAESEPSPPAIEEKEERITEIVSRKEDENVDEWELLSRYEEEEKASVEDMSDEDIFAKILAGDSQKRKDTYEIIGDKKTPKTAEYDVQDREFELKQREEEKFYEKFLQHHKRIRRELPILKVSYDFSKLPDEFSLAREKNILEYSYYKYKPMLEKANEYLQKRKVKDAINYYKVVMAQNIPPEFKTMIRTNINDLTEYLEKFLSAD